MISRDGVSYIEETKSVLDGFNSRRVELSALKKRRVMYVGGLTFPLVQLSSRRFKFIPSFSPLAYFTVNFSKKLWTHGGTNHFIHLIPGWSNVSQKDRISRLVVPDRLSFKVNVDSASKCIGNNEWRAC